VRNIINEILLVLVFFLFGTVITFYLSYLGWLSRHYENRRPRNELGEYSYPSVSLIVPVYNEAQIIDKKLKNIEELIYPEGKFEAIFVDGCSTDETCNLIMDYSLKSKKSIRLIRSEKAKWLYPRDD